MCTAIEAALMVWQSNDAVDSVIIDALSTRAFCAENDIADLYQSGLDKKYVLGQKFWADEYRLNTYCAAPSIRLHSPSDNDYKTRVSPDVMLMELRLRPQAATMIDAATPMGSKAAELYGDFVE